MKFDFAFLKEKIKNMSALPSQAPFTKIEIFVRHCFYSHASFHKKRFENYDPIKCFHNLISTVERARCSITFLLDTSHAKKEKHFLQQQTEFPVIEIQAGCEAVSFLKMLDLVATKSFEPETIIYFLEDDYLHKTGWVEILHEGFTIPSIDYVTLYDHRDKYFLPIYRNLHSKIFHTQSCHWRTTPSTTNTYAMRFKTLLKHLEIHREYSLGRKITSDHEKFCKLKEIGSFLISPIPGWSSHMEPEFSSPCVEWQKML